MNSNYVPKIITNQENNKLVDAINNILENNDITFSRMAVGYFYLSGFDNIKDNLKRVKGLKLLIGNLTNRKTIEEIALGFSDLTSIKNAIRDLTLINKFQQDKLADNTFSDISLTLSRMLQTDTNEEGIKTLSQLIKEERIQIKVHTKGTLHSKAYVFEYENSSDKGCAIVGSSNLSLGGFSGNTELNIVLRDPDDINNIINWFDKLWDEASDFSDKLMKAIDNSWVSLKVSPYLIYLKALYHLIENRLEYETTNFSIIKEVATKGLFEFQKKAFHRAIDILNKYNGVFIADVVGLGKSYIASSLMKYYRDGFGKRALIICPASLVDMWQEYVDEFDLGAKVLSIGKLNYQTEKERNSNYSLMDEENLERYEIVVIDEAHNFRNSNTNRYKIVLPYLARKKTILLTATPQNKSIEDIFNQIKLFHHLDITNIPISESRLSLFMKKARNKPSLMIELLSHILIRRRRKDIIHTAEFKNDKYSFPKRELLPQIYNIEKVYQGGFYSEIMDKLQDKLTYAMYGIIEYIEESARDKPEYQDVTRVGKKLKGLFKTLLFKRFESSVQAFLDTVQNSKLSYEGFRDGLNENKILFNDDLKKKANTDDSDQLSMYDELNERGISLDYNKDFKRDELMKDIENDISVLEELENIAADILKRKKDDKIDTLIKLISKINSEQPHSKILIFSQYIPTVEYIYKSLKERTGKIKKEIEYLTGNIKNKNAIIKKFAPVSNNYNIKNHEKEIDILISTDLLSEGQNLQDANVVINYDIHWNPVRIIQRVGRIDRLTTEHSRIHIYNFLPETELDKRLGLKNLVSKRIDEIHQIIGLDAQVLDIDETLNPESMYDIYEKQDENLLDEDYGFDTSVIENAEQLLTSIKENVPELYKKIKNLPDGVRSAKRSNVNGSFVLLKSNNHIKPYIIKNNDNKQELARLSLSQILEKIKCKKDEERLEITNSHNSNLVKAFNSFKKEIEEKKTDHVYSVVTTRYQKYVLENLKYMYSKEKNTENKKHIAKIEQIFDQELTKPINDLLSDIYKNKITGEPLLDKLSNIIIKTGLENTSGSNRNNFESEEPYILCSEELINEQEDF